MTWIVAILALGAVFVVMGAMRGAAVRKKAPNVLDEHGQPRPENHGGFRPNDEQ